MNFDKLDKIVIGSREEIESLLKWRDNNKELVREFKPTLSEGMIEYSNGLMKIYFKQQGKVIAYRGWFNDEEVITTGIEVKEQGYVPHYTKSIFTAEEEANYRMDIVTIHASLMAYMAHYERNVTKRTVRSTVTKKGKGGNKKKNRTIKIGRAIYDVKVPVEVRTEKRPYTSPTEPFDVKGHFRNYKSGKRVWIESFTKGDTTKEKKPKTYKL